MSLKLEIKAFFFNAKTDYLPYYKHFQLKVDEKATMKDVLAHIQEQNENFNYPKQKLLMRVNGLVTEGKQSVKSIVERFGETLQIDPVNSYRSVDGLKINDDDFMQSFALLAPYASEDDLKYYKTLYPLHYASETSQYHRHYIGDAILVLAHKMIVDGSEHAEAILDAISSPDSGLFDCEYENNLFNAEDHTATIEALKNMVRPEEIPSLCDKLIAKFVKKKSATNKPTITEKNIENLANKRLAHYYGAASHAAMHALIKKHGLSDVHFPKANKLAGLSVLKENKQLAFKKAGTILLDAFDRGAEVLVVEESHALEMFHKHFSAIEKTIGREIGLEIISSEGLKKQISA
jgi:succinate dehydrogenase/fumarate reductase-like Fe-S protein